MEVCRGIGYLISKVSFQKLLTNYKGKSTNSTVSKPGGYHLNQVFGVNITNNGTN